MSVTYCTEHLNNILAKQINLPRKRAKQAYGLSHVHVIHVIYGLAIVFVKNPKEPAHSGHSHNHYRN